MADVANSAETARVADSAKTADAVKAGAITPQMIQSSSITTAQLNEQILKYLKPEITHIPAGTRFDLWRADCHPAVQSRRKISILSMVQEWSAHRRGDG